MGTDCRPFSPSALSLRVPSPPFPSPTALEKQALVACATHVFLQTPDASHAHETLGRVLGPRSMEQLNLFLAFVRTAHYWTKLHPELALEDDVTQLLMTHETLAHCILKDSEAQSNSLSRQVAAELASLREIRKQHQSMAQAYQELSVDGSQIPGTGWDWLCAAPS
jgi:hypothetical protein